MAEIDVTFMHPTDGSTIDVRIDDTMTVSEIINELVNVGFIQRISSEYDLSIKGGTAISDNQTLRNGGTVDKCTIRVVPATLYGCPTVADCDGIVPECMLSTFCGFKLLIS